MVSLINSLVHEKIFKRADGSRVKIQVVLERNYHARVFVCPAKKRTFKPVDITDDYMYKKLPFQGSARKAMEIAEIQKYCSPEEIQEVALELWNANKPNFSNQ